ncbi:hypothetical protein EX30DRAFT_227431 [Ascodesmis nigricans]|uniref:Uncharacterized protein n=1 Tax=Ascodesmis nigricans TaxID=341454 RepID=A0A4S2MNN2_9PEZI|nr:hypothetical protein EX30DRAFT_227431 [Ascodesmis nigricans]
MLVRRNYECLRVLLRTTDKSQVLFHAATRGSGELVGPLVTIGADINERDYHDQTACLKRLSRQHGSVTALLELGSCASGGDISSVTPLSLAASLGDMIVARKLLEKGVRPDDAMRKDDTTPHYAMQNRQNFQLKVPALFSAITLSTKVNRSSPWVRQVESNPEGQKKVLRPFLSFGASKTFDHHLWDSAAPLFGPQIKHWKCWILSWNAPPTVTSLIIRTRKANRFFTKL